jgi:hypothetical protein
MDEDSVLVVFNRGPADGMEQRFVGLDVLGGPNIRLILTYPTDRWLHHYLVKQEGPMYGQPLTAEHVRISELTANDLEDCLGMDG